jgi:hypothetical protein
VLRRSGLAQFRSVVRWGFEEFRLPGFFRPDADHGHVSVIVFLPYHLVKWIIHRGIYRFMIVYRKFPNECVDG